MPPQQSQEDAAVETKQGSSAEPQPETPMEQETPGAANPEPNAEKTTEEEGDQETVDHTKMPEHPGRDSDSEEEEEDDKEQ